MLRSRLLLRNPSSHQAGPHRHRAVTVAARRTGTPVPALQPAKLAFNADVVALDVEYTHVVLVPDPSFTGAITAAPPSDERQREHQLPTSVCLVDRAGTLLHKSYIAPPPKLVADALASGRMLHAFGGVPLKTLQRAPQPGEVRLTLQALLAGRLVLGHGLSHDLGALRLLSGRPKTLMLCTKTWPTFQGNSGTSRSLKLLSQRLLGRQIQVEGQRHDPEEDARAVMDLYLGHIEQQQAGLRGFDALVDYHTHKMVEDSRQRAEELEAAQMEQQEGDEEEEEGGEGEVVEFEAEALEQG